MENGKTGFNLYFMRNTLYIQYTSYTVLRKRFHRKTTRIHRRQFRYYNIYYTYVGTYYVQFLFLAENVTDLSAGISQCLRHR